MTSKASTTMNGRHLLATMAGALALAGLCGGGNAQSLPKSGSISVHTGWKDAGAMVQVAEKRMMGHGIVQGVTFNEKGAGPLHLGAANCVYTFLGTESGDSKNKGFCAFSDPDGDKIFTDWHGGIDANGNGEGVNPIAGGTGKYAGIQGSGPWKCKYAGANGELHCTQRFDYRLP